MTVGHVLMGLLAPGDRHGYDLKRQHDERFPAARPIAPGVVYGALERLRRDGLVAAGDPTRAGGPDRTAFGLTGAGRAELHRWLTDVEPPGPHVTNPLAVKVTLLLLTAGEDAVRDQLGRQRAAHLAAMRVHTRVKNDPATPLPRVLAADYAINHLDADLRWIDTALARVSEFADALTIHQEPA